MKGSIVNSDVNITATELLNSIVGGPPALPMKKKGGPAKRSAAVGRLRAFWVARIRFKHKGESGE